MGATPQITHFRMRSSVREKRSMRSRPRCGLNRSQFYRLAVEGALESMSASLSPSPDLEKEPLADGILNAVSPVTKKTAASLRRLQEARDAEREEAQKQTRKKLEDRHLARVQSEAAATLRPLKNRAEQEFVKAGGDPDDFKSAWDGGLKEKLLIERVSKFAEPPSGESCEGFLRPLKTNRPNESGDLRRTPAASQNSLVNSTRMEENQNERNHNHESS